MRDFAALSEMILEFSPRRVGRQISNVDLSTLISPETASTASGTTTSTSSTTTTSTTTTSSTATSFASGLHAVFANVNGLALQFGDFAPNALHDVRVKGLRRFP